VVLLLAAAAATLASPAAAIPARTPITTAADHLDRALFKFLPLQRRFQLRRGAGLLRGRQRPHAFGGFLFGAFLVFSLANMRRPLFGASESIRMSREEFFAGVIKEAAGIPMLERRSLGVECFGDMRFKGQFQARLRVDGDLGILFVTRSAIKASVSSSNV
jgi:hypothetical protein